MKNTEGLSEIGRQVYKNADSFLSNWIYILYPMFRILGYDPDWDRFSKSTHPPPLIRFSNTFFLMQGFLNRGDFTKKDLTWEAGYLKILEAERAFTEITTHKFNTQLIADIQTRNKIYIESLLKIFRENIKEFEKFTFRPHS